MTEGAVWWSTGSVKVQKIQLFSIRIPDYTTDSCWFAELHAEKPVCVMIWAARFGVELCISHVCLRGILSLSLSFDYTAFFPPSWRSSASSITSLTCRSGNEYKVKYNRGYTKHERHHLIRSLWIHLGLFLWIFKILGVCDAIDSWKCWGETKV